MPRQSEAMKDVLICEKHWLADRSVWTSDFRMGKPDTIYCIIIKWIYSLIKQTEGNETSEYLEEKKSNEIPLVVASEKGRA